MKDPFISTNTLLVGAALFAVLMSAAVIYGTFMPDSQTVEVNPMTVATTTLATSAASTTRAATSTKTIATTTATTTTKIQATSTKVAATTTKTTSLKTTITVSISPAQIIEGDPVLITLSGGSAAAPVTTADIKSAALTAQGPNMPGRSATTALNFINYARKIIAFYGTGINQTTGKATVTVTMKDGTKTTGTFTIAKRVSPTESLPVPEQLGGNSTSSQQNLVSTLDAENAELANVYSNPSTSFWSGPFAWPIHPADITGGIVITDQFGYERDSGAESIIHKGIDFKAPPGTPVYAINAGYVRMTQLFTVYGNTVIVDHGMGIQSFYMHLSKMVVKPGDAVTKGQLLGYSGETGYSEGPHLHLTVRIGGISIDPLVFYQFFLLKPDAIND